MSAGAIQFSFVDVVLQIKSLDGEMRLRLRPTPVAEELPASARRWRPFWPELRLLRPSSEADAGAPGNAAAPADEAAAQKAAAFAAFRQELSADVATAVELFGSNQWPLLVLLHEAPGALELARSNPVLAYCLANNDQFRGTRPEAAAIQAVWYCNRKQRIILEWLGFPGTEAMARLMRKIPSEDASPFMLRCLGNALSADAQMLAALGHLPRISAPVMELVASGRLGPLVTPKLLQEVADRGAEPGEPSCGDLMMHSLIMLKEFMPRRPIGPFSQVAQVRRCHEEIEQEYLLYRRCREQAEQAAREEQAAQVEQARARRRRVAAQPPQRKRDAEGRPPPPLPPPPLPGTDDIVPITTVADLVAEGQEQCNCVASYEGWVRQGSTYIYRVLAPERATLSLVRSYDGGWRRSELKARRNRKVQVQTMLSVDAWVAKYRASV